MFFAKGRSQLSKTLDGKEVLCIFGPFEGRRGAELKVLSSVEHKSPGHCVSSKGTLRDVERVRGDEDKDGWGTDFVLLSDDNFSYALGAQGSTRRKLAASSGCIVEYVGKLACFRGFKSERRRGKDYLRWLIEQRTGQSVVEKPERRSDCSIVKIPIDSIAFMTGHRGESLRGIERESATFCFTDGDRNQRTRDYENLLIFSHSRAAREHAVEIVEDRLYQHKRMGGRGGDGGGGYRDNDRGRDSSRRDRDRDRSRDRGRRRRDDYSDDDRDRDRSRRDRSRRDRSRSRDRRR